MKVQRKKNSQYETIYFIVMGNLFCTDHVIDIRYDLKGSSYGRTSKRNGQFPKDKSIALKDLDWLEKGMQIDLRNDDRDKFIMQMERDVQFFDDNEIIDYSLLIGYAADNSHDHDNNKPFDIQNIGESLLEGSEGSYDSHNDCFNQQNKYQRKFDRFYEQYQGGLQSGDEKQVIFLGIIDIMTEYNEAKKWEHQIKKQIQGRGISCVPPKEYARRFRDFMVAQTKK